VGGESALRAFARALARASPTNARRQPVTTSSHQPDEPETLEADPADVADQRLPADTSTTDDDDPTLEADPADVADQRLPADTSTPYDDDDATLDQELPTEADPADVADQRREAPPEDPEP
jgi:hypothetical protein